MSCHDQVCSIISVVRSGAVSPGEPRSVTIKRLIIGESTRRAKQMHRFLSTPDYSFTFRHKGMQRTKSACLIELSASMKPLAAYKVTEREGTEGSGRYGLAELVPRSGVVSLSFRAERSQAERPGLWPEGVAGCIPRFRISSTYRRH